MAMGGDRGWLGLGLGVLHNVIAGLDSRNQRIPRAATLSSDVLVRGRAVGRLILVLGHLCVEEGVVWWSSKVVTKKG